MQKLAEAILYKGPGKTKIDVIFYKESGKMYTSEEFYTNDCFCFETEKIKELIEGGFPEYGNKNYSFQAKDISSRTALLTDPTNYQMVIRSGHKLDCPGCIECSNGDEHRQELKDPLSK